MSHALQGLFVLCTDYFLIMGILHSFLSCYDDIMEFIYIHAWFS